MSKKEMVAIVAIMMMFAVLAVASLREEKKPHETTVNVILEVGKQVSVGGALGISGEEHFLLLTDIQEEEYSHPFCLGACPLFRVAYVQHSWVAPRPGAHMEDKNITGIDHWFFRNYGDSHREEDFSTGNVYVSVVERNISIKNGTMEMEVELQSRDYSRME